jgi:hypothetical protein
MDDRTTYRKSVGCHTWMDGLGSVNHQIVQHTYIQRTRSADAFAEWHRATIVSAISVTSHNVRL